jgi:hypothetical protein
MGHDGGEVHMRGEANSLKSRRTGRAMRARRVIRMRGRCDGAGKKSAGESRLQASVRTSGR